MRHWRRWVTPKLRPWTQGFGRIRTAKPFGGTEFNPSPEDGIDAGDFLIAMGGPQQLRNLEQTAEAKL
jgi:hypothetical protein